MKSRSIVQGIVLAIVALTLGSTFIATTSVVASAAVFPSNSGR